MLQDIRDYELDYEAAKKAAASAAAEAEKEEERRIKLLEKNPLGEFMPEEEEMLNIGVAPSCSMASSAFMVCIMIHVIIHGHPQALQSTQISQHGIRHRLICCMTSKAACVSAHAALLKECLTLSSRLCSFETPASQEASPPG